MPPWVLAGRWQTRHLPPLFLKEIKIEGKKKIYQM
jgi:hypothetical protein